MEERDAPSLDGLGEAERLRALSRFQILRPFLEGETTLTEIAQIARVLEINRLDRVSSPVVEAARESLVIGTV